MNHGTTHSVALITLGITECHKTKLSPHNEQEQEGLIEIYFSKITAACIGLGDGHRVFEKMMKQALH